MAVEEYDDYGPVHDFAPAGQQAHQIYYVVNKAIRGIDVEGGIGVGMNDASDRVTFKLILSKDLNKK